MRRAVVVTIALTISLPAQSADVVWRKGNDSIMEQADVIPPGQFTESNLLRLCSRFLAAHKEAFVLRYLIVTDAKEAVINARGWGLTDTEFLAWRDMYLRQSPNPPATAEMVLINNRAAVRIRYSDGRLRERVVLNSSPFRLAFRGEKVHLLSLTPTLVYAPQGGQSEWGAKLFFQTPTAWDLSRAEAFSRMLRKEKELRSSKILLENGWWFAGEIGYPIFNRFLPYRIPPTFEEFKKHHRFLCNESSGECHQRGPALK